MRLAPTARGLLVVPKEWPYWVGGLSIAVVNTALLLIEGRPWGITTTITHVASRGLQVLGFRPEDWAYFQVGGRAEALSNFGWSTGILWFNLGIVAGVMLSAWTGNELTVKARLPWRKAALALAGGVLMGYGARLASGCNAGALLGSLPGRCWAACRPGVCTAGCLPP